MTKPLLKKSADPRQPTRLVDDSHSDPSLPEGFPCVIYEADASLQILRASANVRELLGIERDQIIGSSRLFDEGVVPADRDQLKRTLLELPASGISSVIHRLIDDHGRIVEVAHGLQITNLHNQKLIRGTIIPLIVPGGQSASIDVGLVSKFLHKIGNHFQLLNLMLHSIRRTGSNLKELEQVQETTEKAVDLTHSFANYLQQPALSTYVNLSELLDSLLESRIVIGRQKNLRFMVRNDGRLCDATIQGDSTLLEMAIGAVLDNAIDASPFDGEISVQVAVSPEIHGATIARTLQLQIADGGSAVPTDRSEASLEPFQMNAAEGNGMGLALAYRYLAIHGGVLKVYREDGQRNIAEIALPVAILPHSKVYEKLAPSS